MLLQHQTIYVSNCSAHNQLKSKNLNSGRNWTINIKMVFGVQEVFSWLWSFGAWSEISLDVSISRSCQTHQLWSHEPQSVTKVYHGVVMGWTVTTLTSECLFLLSKRTMYQTFLTSWSWKEGQLLKKINIFW